MLFICSCFVLSDLYLYSYSFALLHFDTRIYTCLRLRMFIRSYVCSKLCLNSCSSVNCFCKNTVSHVFRFAFVVLHAIMFMFTFALSLCLCLDTRIYTDLRLSMFIRSYVCNRLCFEFIVLFAFQKHSESYLDSCS